MLQYQIDIVKVVEFENPLCIWRRNTSKPKENPEQNVIKIINDN